MGIFDFLKKKKEPVVIPEGFGTSRWETVASPEVPSEPSKESAYSKLKQDIGTAVEKVEAAGEYIEEDIKGAGKSIKALLEEREKSKIRKMEQDAEKLRLKNELAAQKKILRDKGEDAWGKFARTASRTESVAKGVGKVLKNVSTLGGPISGPLKDKSLYIPKAQKGMYFDPEGTRALTLPGGSQEQAQGGLRSASTPHLGMLRQAGAPPSGQPRAGLARPQGPNYAALRGSGNVFNFSMLRDITLPKGLSKIEKTAIGEIHIHQGNPLDVLAGLGSAGYTPAQSNMAIKQLALKGLVRQGSDKTLELVEVQK